MKHLELALNYVGTKETVGEKHNPVIVGFFDYIGHSWVKDDETAWCSAFMNFIAKKAGLQFSGKLNARSWMNVGTEVLKPKLGDIAVFWRESPTSWKGHVGIFIRETETLVYVLGGNQSNSVKISAYKKDQLLAYKRL